MSVLETGQCCTSELVADLEWPGVDLQGCYLLVCGTITGIDKPNKFLEYERAIEGVDSVKRGPIGLLSLSGVELHPPENGAPLDTRQKFWCYFDPYTFKMAILRDGSVYSR